MKSIRAPMPHSMAQDKNEERIKIVKSHGLYGKKYLNIDIREREIGAPGDEEVIVKVHACGVCGTDVNFVRDWSEDYMPLGHEIAAEVVEVGKNVKTYKPGNKVIVEDCTMCGVCTDCKNGEVDKCRNMYDLGGQPGMAEYMCVRQNSLDPFDGLDYKYACLTEPLAVALNLTLNAEIPLGGSVVVLGPGPQGLMAARLAKIRGAGTVFVVGLSRKTRLESARLDLAEKMGADRVIASADEDVEQIVKSKFPKGVDRVLVTSPPQSILSAIKVIRFGGIISFIGLHFGGKNEIPLDVNEMIFRKITLRPTFAEPAIKFPTSNRLLKDGLIDASPLVTHTFTFKEAKRTFGGIVEANEPIIKAVLLPHG